ncbi:Protein of unknown function [Clostridium sp. USBA 49]|jgi:uncharacterized protein YrzB (UPF0473 family)|uniref:DUF1292 domain-containing protein n=1 Tax=Clostridium TaxID=1485 RepID=UPI000999EA27|nr:MULTISPECIES: DUF1292 domain-containing protein [Clostridium]SKA72762.1 Protein of unknown function [Clostridium sp. USBA 49]
MSEEKLHNSCCEEDTCDCGCGEHEHVEGCDCGHDHGAMIVDLEDENGNIVSCEVVDGFTYKENDYVLVQNPEDGSVYLFKVVGEEGELVIPEDDEFEEVSKYYEQSLEEEE